MAPAGFAVPSQCTVQISVGCAAHDIATSDVVGVRNLDSVPAPLGPVLLLLERRSAISGFPGFIKIHGGEGGRGVAVKLDKGRPTL